MVVDGDDGREFDAAERAEIRKERVETQKWVMRLNRWEQNLEGIGLLGKFFIWAIGGIVFFTLATMQVLGKR